MRIKPKSVLKAVIAIVVLLALVLPWVAQADDISNNLDASIDSVLETMNLTQGGANGSTNLFVSTSNGDGKNGCNLTGGTTLVVSVNTSNASVATVLPASVTFASCGATPTLTVTPHNPGSANITLMLTSNDTGASFNLAPAAFTVNVASAPPSDTTPPSITPTVTGTLGNNGWYTSNVTVTWTVTDSQSGISSSSGCEPTTITADTNGTTLNCSATSAGGTNSQSVTIKRDATAPAVTCTPPDQTIWYGANQTVNCTASDGVSGLAVSADASFSLSTSVAANNETNSAATNSHVVSDNAGNISTAGPYTFKVDRKAPDVVCGSADGVWHAANVTINCSATDGGSGLADSADNSFTLTTTVAIGDETNNAATGTHTVTDDVGNSSTAGPISGNKVDLKAPVVTCGNPDGVWHATDVNIGCTATDGGSGLANPADAIFSLSTNVASGTETNNASTNSRSVADTVGNATTAGPISGNWVDKKAPEISCDGADGAWHGSNVSIACTATDDGSGLADSADSSFSLMTDVANGDETNNAMTGSRVVADNVGNTATAGPIGGNKVDRKAPVVTCAAPDDLWHATDATIACTASDGGSQLAQPSDASFSLTTNVPNGNETANAATNSYDVVDNVGNTMTAGPIAGNKVDKKAPAVTCGSADGDWHASNVTINCSATDGGSGLADSADNSFILTTTVASGDETDNAATGSHTVADTVGNSSTAGPISGNKVDLKAPVVSCNAADGAWHSANVNIACTASDHGSGLADSADESFTLTTTVAPGTETNNAATGSHVVSDNLGHSTTAGPISGNMVDLKAPVVTCGSADGSWHATNVSIACTATDGGSGLADPLDASFNLTTTVAPGDEQSNASTNSHAVSDGVGNTSPAGPISGNMVDQKAPAITINAPTHTTYLLGQVVTANYGCTDGGSGLASCSGTVANGSNIDTASVGTKTFTVNAKDNVGNTSSSSVTYSVVYASSGMCLDSPGHQILQPINVDGTSVFKQGSTVPAKFRVCDANGNSIGTPGLVSDFKLIKKSNGTSSDVNETVVSTSAADSNFRWDPGAQQWIFNINTKNLTKGYTYTYQITLNDGSNIQFSFGLK